MTASVASDVNPARATVGLEAADNISSLSLLLSAAEYGFPQYAWRDWYKSGGGGGGDMWNAADGLDIISQKSKSGEEGDWAREE